VKSPSNGPEAGQGEQVLDVRVGLVGSVPEIWRRLELRASLTLAEVHRVLQVAFGWEDAHLHRFTDSDPFAPLRPIDGEIPDTVQWMPQDCCEEPTDLPEEGCSLDQLLVSGSGAAFYEYDFGDSWLHRMELVTRRPVSEATVPARLTGGARRGPLEDSGGLPGYESILDALADPTRPDHAECSEWVAAMTNSEEPFDSDLLDTDEVNRTLAAECPAADCLPDT
jgi:hypothetical protein